MEKIKDISKLPDWLSKRIYKKQLSDIDWYREVRLRQRLLSVMSVYIESPIEKDDKSRLFLNQMLERDDIRPDSMAYVLPQGGTPVQDLTVSESVFLEYSIRNSDVSEFAEQYRNLLSQWTIACDDIEASAKAGTPRLTYGMYDRHLPKFLDRLEGGNSNFDCPITSYSNQLGNPWLSYGRPLNGYPVTIDAQFDDETILQNVKAWLVKTRESEGTKARRPFNQNDFDDWEFYKIRELFDLQTWALLNDKKILDRVLADYLWPNSSDEFSPIDVLRTTARKKTKEVFTFDTVTRLYGQLNITHGENFLLK